MWDFTVLSTGHTTLRSAGSVLSMLDCQGFSSVPFHLLGSIRRSGLGVLEVGLRKRAVSSGCMQAINSVPESPRSPGRANRQNIYKVSGCED